MKPNKVPNIETNKNAGVFSVETRFKKYDKGAIHGVNTKRDMRIYIHKIT